MDKSTFSLYYALQQIFKQLDKASKDPRKRERLRAQTALRHINAWIKEGEEEYEKRKNIKSNSINN